MTQTDPDGGESSSSIFETAATVLRGRRRIALWSFGAGLLMALATFSKPPLYRASAAFVSQSYDGSRASGLASLAGQLGAAFPLGGQSQTLEFYSRLLRSRDLLGPIVRDTFVVAELGGKRTTLLDLFEIEAPSAAAREEKGVEALSKLLTTKVVRLEAVVEFSVETEWPSVSLAIAERLVQGVNDFNQRIRQGQAGAERRFVQERLALAKADLRAAEDRLVHFYNTNRNYEGAPQLVFEHSRLQRELNLQQQVFASLTQSHEDARIREVRNTPVISVAEIPAVRARPEPRGRVKSVLTGLILGGMAGTALELARAWVTRRRREGDPELGELLGVIDEMPRPFRLLTGRRGA